MGVRRSRTPDESGARDIGRALYPDLDNVSWIPSDDADVFRLSFTSGREPRILKMARQGIPAVWRELGAFPAMQRLDGRCEHQPGHLWVAFGWGCEHLPPNVVRFRPRVRR